MKGIVLCSILYFYTQALLGQKNLRQLVKENEKSVFLIQCFNDKNQIIATGSGFFISDSGTALTNVHVIKTAYHARIKTSDGRFYDVEKLVDYNTTLDIAKIKVRNSTLRTFIPVKIAKREADKGEDVFAIGNPDGLENSVSAGIVSALRNITNYGACYQITTPISPGSSGGALFNMGGEVIGITSFGQIDADRLNQNLNFAVNINNIKYLNRNLNIPIEKAYKEVIYEDFITGYLHAELSGDLSRALEICNAEIEKHPSSFLAYHFRGYLYLGSNKYTEAEVDFKEAIKLNSTDNLKDLDFIGLGKIHRSARMFEEAKEAYIQALQINDKNAICYCNLAVLAFDWLGPENELVEKSYTMALQIDPTSCSFGYKKLGEKMMASHDFEKAVNFFSMAIGTEKDKLLSINEFYNRGCAYYYLKKFEEAISDFTECINLIPNDYQSYFWIGLCKIAIGKKIDGCAALNKAKEINDAFSKDTKANEAIQNALLSNCK